MKSRLALQALIMTLLAAPASSAAQTSAEVTVKVPVNLTQLGPDVAKVMVSCAIQSQAITTGTNNSVFKSEVIAVSGGQLVTTFTLVFSITSLNNPVGQPASINCGIMGFSTSQQGYLTFDQAAANPSFRTTPSLRNIGPTNFVW